MEYLLTLGKIKVPGVQEMRRKQRHEGENKAFRSLGKKEYKPAYKSGEFNPRERMVRPRQKVTQTPHEKRKITC